MSRSTSVAREAEPEIEAAVRAGRKLRNSLKQPHAARVESESIMRVLRAMVEYAHVQRMDVTFKRCTATCDEDEEELQYYELVLQVNKNDDMHSVPMSGLSLSAALRGDVKQTLAQQDKPDEGVSLGLLKATYDDVKQSFSVECVLHPPTMKAEEVQVKRKRRPTLPTKQISMPEADECVDFYTKRVNTWSMFGYNLSDIFQGNAANGGGAGSAAGSARDRRGYRRKKYQPY